MLDQIKTLVAKGEIRSSAGSGRQAHSCRVGDTKGRGHASSAGRSISASSGALVFGFQREEEMRTRRFTKLVHEGKYVAEVDVEQIETDSGWSPYLSLDDTLKLDHVRDALRRGDVRAASRQARLVTLTPVAV